MVTGPMPRNPNATSPNAKIGAAKRNWSGIIACTAACPEKQYAPNIRLKMQSPVQKAEKLPATSPERMFRDAPPCFDEVTTSFTCRLSVDVKILVNSGINAPAIVPSEMMLESTHHKPA